MFFVNDRSFFRFCHLDVNSSSPTTVYLSWNTLEIFFSTADAMQNMSANCYRYRWSINVKSQVFMVHLSYLVANVTFKDLSSHFVVVEMTALWTFNFQLLQTLTSIINEKTIKSILVHRILKCLKCIIEQFISYPFRIAHRFFACLYRFW